MPLITRRSSTRATPLGLFGSNGSISRHSASLRSYLAIQGLLPESLNQASHRSASFMSTLPKRGSMALHMIKLVVGAATIEDLLEWRRQHAGADEPWILRTRMTPKRGVEMVDGGSIYRVFKGVILCRQRILAVNT